MDGWNVRVRGRLCILFCSKDALCYLKPSVFRSFTRASRRLAPSSDSKNKQHVWRINPARLSEDCQTTPPQWWTGWMFAVYLPPGCAAVSKWTVPVSGADNTRKEHRAISLCRRRAKSAQTPRPPSLASGKLQEKAWYIGVSFPQLSKSMLTRTSPRASHFLSCFCTRLVTPSVVAASSQPRILLATIYNLLPGFLTRMSLIAASRPTVPQLFPNKRINYNRRLLVDCCWIQMFHIYSTEDKHQRWPPVTPFIQSYAIYTRFCILSFLCGPSLMFASWQLNVRSASGCLGPGVADRKSFSSPDGWWSGIHIQPPDLPPPSSSPPLSLFPAPLLAAFALTSQRTAFKEGCWNSFLFSQCLFNATNVWPLRLFVRLSRPPSLHHFAKFRASFLP